MIDIVDFRQRMVETRTYTEALFAAIEPADFCRQVHAEFSPLGWHLGHIGVTEGFWVLQQCQHAASLSAGYDAVFSPLDNPKANRVNLPVAPEIFAYIDTVRARVFAFLERGDWPDSHPLLGEGRLLNMLLQHEEQHTETILLILNLLAARRFDAGDRAAFSSPAVPCRRPAAQPSRTTMVRIPAGAYSMGSDDSARTLDNERPARQVRLEEFWIDQTPVTNADFLEFLDDGGYLNSAWWSQPGWRWRVENQIAHPLHWRSGSSQGHWLEIDPWGVSSLDPAQPVRCVSWYEAEAYAHSVGKRLPTEAEWEKAAWWEAEQPAAAAPSDLLAPRLGLLGGVWEWTRTWFHPYPGFRAFPYDGYSVPYFGQHHRVLRGGSWATRRHVLRATFRNWYHPGMRAVFAGFRCAKDAVS